MTAPRTVLAVLSLVAALAATSTATARGDDQVVSGACTMSGESKLKVGQRDGKLEIEFEVDANVRGQKWNVVMEDNGAVFYQRVRKTKGQSGSFEARKKIADRAGTDAVEAMATNPATGESCSASLSV